MIIFSTVFGIVIIFAIAAAFIVTPRFANNPIVPPFTLNIPLEGGIDAEIINPGIPLVQVNGWSNEVSDYFFGFDTNLDLRYRGGLSDDVVMYVRSPSQSYWRSHSYDFYDGALWSQSNKDLINLHSRAGVNFRISTPLGGQDHIRNLDHQQQVVQTFTIVRDQPNLIFAAYRPSEIFITAENISVDSGDGLRAPQPLKAGMTYSIISYRPEFEPELLRQASDDYPSEINETYLQLPDNISDRVKNLAKALTEPYDNAYDKALALNNHLLAEYPYDFFPPPHKPGAEVVDTFLFEDQRGFCEQYVTSFVVMARSLGIPARLTTGYGSGDYNPVTNYYEVQFSDAHSWAEVYFPEYGWVPFDPTPGWTPLPYPTPVQNWLFANGANNYLDFDLSGVSFGPIISGGALGIAVIIPVIVGLALIAGLVLLGIFLSRQFRQMRMAQAANYYTPIDNHPYRQAILKIYKQSIAFLVKHRYGKREAWETPDEYVQRAQIPQIMTKLTQAVEIAAYRPEAPGKELLQESKEAIDALRSSIVNKADVTE
ncbi:MAG: transglutaminaseTgpA domain-containing protein [Chloroflexota bacterium]